MEHVESFGYVLGPRTRDGRSQARGLLTRLGVSVALSLNAMIFAIAGYAGLATGPLHRLFGALNLGLATGVVLVGGTVFFRAAWQGLRRRALHLDLPIALGIAASYAGSVHAWATGGAPYFDTVCVFVTLMLAGRFLRQRVLEKNRRMLLEGADASGLLTRRVGEGGSPELVPCTRVREGDRLWIGPGDLLPVDGRVEEEASFSLDWISGESAPRRYEAGAAAPAGAFNTGSSAVVVRAETDFESSPLVDILRTPVRGVDDARGQPPLWQRFASVYVVGVLALALGGFAAWLHLSHDLHRAIGVATAVLVVTCPCAFGIATPLGYEVVQAELRRRGLFVRSAGFLDRAARVTRVAFDKTGTLTTGSLDLQDASVLDGLDARDASVLGALAAATAHPKSAAVHGELARRGVAPAPVRAAEVAGRGVEVMVDGARYRLGEPAWVAPDAAGDIAFGRDGRALVSLATQETLRPDARAEVAKLGEAGLDVWILSGDEPARVRAVAREVGVPESRALGGLSADDKAAWLRANDRGDTLMVGDGINDLRAVALATCSGTPAVDRPFVAARSDFYFTTPGLAPIRASVRAGRQLGRVVRRNLAVALTYNAAAVGVALAGLMTPLFCAVLMPASSLSTIFATVVSLSARSRAWRS